jgi:hypothetical protein
VVSDVKGRWVRVFKNRLLRKIFGPEGEEVTRDWKKLYNGGFVIFTSHQI